MPASLTAAQAIGRALVVAEPEVTKQSTARPLRRLVPGRSLHGDESFPPLVGSPELLERLLVDRARGALDDHSDVVTDGHLQQTHADAVDLADDALRDSQPPPRNKGHVDPELVVRIAIVEVRHTLFGKELNGPLPGGSAGRMRSPQNFYEHLPHVPHAVERSDACHASRRGDRRRFSWSCRAPRGARTELAGSMIVLLSWGARPQSQLMRR